MASTAVRHRMRWVHGEARRERLAEILDAVYQSLQQPLQQTGYYAERNEHESDEDGPG
jgi:hypothetical protein